MGPPRPDEDLVSRVFSFIPQGFRKGAVAGWKANIHWAVDGGTDHTIVVADDGCTVHCGLTGEPTTTVTIGRDTLIGLFGGEIDATAVFMSGRARADNMGDLMRLSQAFDFAQIASAYRASGGAIPAAAIDDFDAVSTVFSYFPRGFRVGAAPKWEANIQWQVAGGTDQTIVVQSDICTIHHHLQGTPTCTVKIGVDTLLSLFKGEVQPVMVFLNGQASADNMGDLMKMAMAFDFQAAGAAFLTENS